LHVAFSWRPVPHAASTGLFILLYHEFVKMPATKKLSKLEKAKLKVEIARLGLECKSQVEISTLLSTKERRLTQQMVSYYMREVEKEWLDDAKMNVEKARGREIAKINHLERKYWDLLKYEGVQWCIEQRTKLLGLEAPKQFTGLMGNFDQTKLTIEQLERLAAGENPFAVIAATSISGN